MRPALRVLLVLATASGVASPAAPVADAPHLTGLYSDLAYHDRSGDLVGMEVFLVAGAGGYFATVQCAGGEPAQPVVVPVRVKAAQIAFTLPAGQPECGTEFVGTVSVTGLRGQFTGRSGRRWLPRRRSYWQ